MKAVVHRLSKLKLKTFKVSYSPTYTNYILNHIATNPSHPLYISQRRRQQEHKKEGLWWHATNGIDISKSGCVRTWARRRLRQAFVEELRDKGYDEMGKLVNKNAMQGRSDVMNVLRLERSIDLTGSLRMHGVGPLIPARFETVKEEMRGIVDALIQSAVDTALGFRGEGAKSSGLGQRSAPSFAPPSTLRQQERKAVVVPKTLGRNTGATKELPMRKSQKVSEEYMGRVERTSVPREADALSESPRMKPQAVSREASPRSRNTLVKTTKAGATPEPSRVKPQAKSAEAPFRIRRRSV